MARPIPNKLLIEERINREVALKRAGLSYRQIGAEVGVSQTQVRKDILRALNRVAMKQESETLAYRELELQRLEELWFTYYQQAKGYVDKAGKIHEPDPDAAKLLLNISRQRSTLLGLNAPIMVDNHHSGQVTLSWEDTIREAGLLIPPSYEGYEDVIESLEEEN
jgi:hypothetical protein